MRDALAPPRGSPGAGGAHERDHILSFDDMGLKRMDNVGIVVEDLAATIGFLSPQEVGLELEEAGSDREGIERTCHRIGR